MQTSLSLPPKEFLVCLYFQIFFFSILPYPQPSTQYMTSVLLKGKYAERMFFFKLACSKMRTETLNIKGNNVYSLIDPTLMFL